MPFAERALAARPICLLLISHSLLSFYGLNWYYRAWVFGLIGVNRSLAPPKGWHRQRFKIIIIKDDSRLKADRAYLLYLSSIALAIRGVLIAK